MFFNLFGSLTAGLIRLAITAATILLIYFFILKPILATTENVTGGITGGTDVQKILDSVNETFKGKGSDSVASQIEGHLRGLDSGAGGSQSQKARRLLNCIQNSTGNAERMQRCARRFAH